MAGFTLDWGSATDRGHHRRINEDALLAQPPVFLVADGMGGHRAGHTASAAVVDEFGRPPGATVVTSDWVVDAFARADNRIRDGLGGGTTVAGVAVVQQRARTYWLVFNIGDSRVYRCAAGRLTQVTVDHSVVQELLELGRITAAELRGHRDRHVITRAVGLSDQVRPDFWLLPLQPGERLLLCSDGLTSEVDVADIAAVVAGTQPPQTVADALVRLALDRGGRDNVTAVVVDVLSVDETAPADDALDDDTAGGGLLVSGPIDDATSPRGRTGAR